MAVRALETLVPFSRGGQKPQANGERVHSQRLAIGNARAGAEVSLRRMQVEPFVSLPRLTGNNARAMRADVFCNAFLGSLADVQAPKIHSYCNGQPSFQALGHSFHGTPRAYRAGWEAEYRGGNDHTIIHLKGSFRPRIFTEWQSQTSGRRIQPNRMMVSCFPGGAIPLSSTLWVPRQDQRVTTVSASGMMSPIVNQKRPRGGAGAIPSVSFQAQMASATVCHQATPAAIE